VLRTGDGSARRLSDFLSRAELHALDLYREVFAPLGIEYQIGFSLPSRRPLQIGVGLGRYDHDFDDHERDLLNTLRPHLIHAYRRAQILSDHTAALDSIASALEVHGWGELVIADDNTASAVGPALAMLEKHFGCDRQ
jgi:hypothetical protein